MNTYISLGLGLRPATAVRFVKVDPRVAAATGALDADAVIEATCAPAALSSALELGAAAGSSLSHRCALRARLVAKYALMFEQEITLSFAIGNPGATASACWP